MAGPEFNQIGGAGVSVVVLGWLIRGLAQVPPRFVACHPTEQHVLLLWLFFSWGA